MQGQATGTRAEVQDSIAKSYEALELTQLYVQSAYSQDQLDEHVLDRLRKFWITYEKLRHRIIH